MNFNQISEERKLFKLIFLSSTINSTELKYIEIYIELFRYFFFHFDSCHQRFFDVSRDAYLVVLLCQINLLFSELTVNDTLRNKGGKDKPSDC